MELTDTGYLWLYKSWAVACDGGACRGAMACFALSHVSTERERAESSSTMSPLDVRRGETARMRLV